MTPDHADHGALPFSWATRHVHMTALFETLLHSNSHVLPQLKHSLSLALLHYLPLAGKLTWPPHVHIPTISYAPDDAVSLLFAESSADFNRLSGDDISESSESGHLIPELLSYDDRASCMALQITLFPNQGLCIGVSKRHAVLEGISAIAFMKSWAYLCTQLDKQQYPSLLPELTPFFDRTVVKDPVGLGSLYLNNWLDFMGNQRHLKVLEDFGVDRNSVRATFKLNVEDIKKLGEKISSSQPLHLSTFVVTCAYVLVCLVKAREGESIRNVNFLFPVDYRNRLDPPLPANYFGNGLSSSNVILKPSVFMEENGVATVAVKISNIIREINEKRLLEGAEETLEKLKNWEEGEERISMARSNKFT
ncbi:phenolic glucoside malonyltransferase 1-like [Mangifera indica]|uniref:phenolic glucoside malonyltransferase 1-like n=1 Tax=Mangifera indica TaxID=29780 RepID=UPI001CF93695|nr:phenolic glucoside malonyltransferase 1-like [Mangifera indica]